MKNKLLVAALILLTFSTNNTYSQDKLFPLNKDGKIEISEVVETNNLNKNQMFSNAKQWVTKTFGDYKKAVQVEDDENFKLIVKGSTNLDIKITEGNGILRYLLTIECKDGKYRYIIEDVSTSGSTEFLGNYYETTAVPITHLQTIAGSKLQIQELENSDTTKFKKKELKSYYFKLNKLRQQINSEEILYNKEYNGINYMISSLKLAMIKNDNF